MKKLLVGISVTLVFFVLIIMIGTKSSKYPVNYVPGVISGFVFGFDIDTIEGIHMTEENYRFLLEMGVIEPEEDGYFITDFYINEIKYDSVRIKIDTIQTINNKMIK